MLTLAGSAGCDGGGGGGGSGGSTVTGVNETIDETGFETLPCVDGARARLPGLVLEPPADYLALRAAGEIVESIGTPCATATDVPACNAAIESPTGTGAATLGDCLQECLYVGFIVNRGDEVTVLHEEIVAELGAIDSGADALLAVELKSYGVGCGSFTQGGVREVAGGYEVLASKVTEPCSPIVRTRYRLNVSATGQITELESDVVEYSEDECIGRRPAGLADWRCRGPRSVGAHFANIAYLEAAAVDAFELLRRDLVRHGAPARLVRAAVRSKREEVRHALVTARLARRYGVAPPPRPVVAPVPPRSLEEIAIENAVEGCTKETFGALVGAWQARRAADPVVRNVMHRIAADETQHAALSWEIDRWARSRLSDAGRERVEEARRAALARLTAVTSEPEGALSRAAGLPSRAEHRALAERFCEAFAS